MVRQINKRVYLISFFIGLIALMVIGVGWIWARSALVPRLVVSDIALGAYKPGDTLERTMLLENQGSGELR